MSSKPTTPSQKARDGRRKLLRSSGIYKILPQSPKVHYPQDVLPLETESNEERLEVLADSLSQLENNMCELAKIHNAVNSGFNEPFASFLYGLSITMFCNNFPGCPTRETYGTNQDDGHEERIKLLQERIRSARAENQRLKQQIATKTAESRTLAARAELLPRRTPNRLKLGTFAHALPASRQRKVVVAHDDTYSTNDSFVDVPSIAAGQNRILKSLVAAGSKQTTSKAIPNLDQPPRYMRGLFDKTGSSNLPRNVDLKTRARGPTSSSVRRQAERPNRLAGRPPFR